MSKEHEKAEHEKAVIQNKPEERPEFYPIGNPAKDSGIKPEPWDNQAFYDKVRAAGFPTSAYGDAAFMNACYNLAEATQPPPPEPPPPEKQKHAH